MSANRPLKWFLVLIALIAVVFIGIQFVPVDRDNPPVTMEVDAPPEVMVVLRQSCYDCHSNETVWPWYSYVAPVAWRVAGHVDHARKTMNFSEWDRYDADRRARFIEECIEEVDSGVMPLSDYLGMHEDAVLSQADIEVLRRWASGIGE